MTADTAPAPLKARDAIHEVVTLGLAPMLKSRGFRRRALVFVRRQGSVAQVVHVQPSAWSRGTDGQFFVNVGVLFDDICRLHGRLPPERPKPDHCHFLVRLETLDAAQPDAFDVEVTTDLDALARRVANAVEAAFVRPLDGVSSTADFDRLGWQRITPWSFPALLRYVLGDVDEARELVQQQADAFADRGVTFESVSASLGLAWD